MSVGVVSHADEHLHLVVQEVVHTTHEGLLEKVSKHQTQAEGSYCLKGVIFIVRFDHCKRHNTFGNHFNKRPDCDPEGPAHHLLEYLPVR
jgi:hypothetical protein